VAVLYEKSWRLHLTIAGLGSSQQQLPSLAKDLALLVTSLFFQALNDVTFLKSKVENKRQIEVFVLD
jgi:hypothetical protein